MAATSQMPLNPIFLFFSLLLFSLSSAIRDHQGFSTSLFHRDSPLSPQYNSSLSHYDRLRNAILRSFSRSKTLSRLSLSSESSVIQSPIIPGNGEFLMEVMIGTPAVKFIGTADTGSDLTWTQCQPCDLCFDQSLPIFDPRRSSSYRQILCRSDYCNAIATASCNSDHKTCHYIYSYGDSSSTEGDLAYESITLGSGDGRPFVSKNTVVGCGHQNEGTYTGAESGLIGLGGGSLSLVAQLNKTAGVQPQFSYCLPPYLQSKNVTSKISFGGSAAVSGSRVVSTPLITKDPDTYYYLNLEGVSVGKKRISTKRAPRSAGSSKSSSLGNIIIDSGTTLTFIPEDLYSSVAATLEKGIKGKRAVDPTGLLKLCYAANEKLNIPDITVHFTGADVKLPPLNTFAKVADNVICFTSAPTSDFAIYGNLAQMNFLIGYDLASRKVSFKPTTCG